MPTFDTLHEPYFSPFPKISFTLKNNNSNSTKPNFPLQNPTHHSHTTLKPKYQLTLRKHKNHSEIHSTKNTISQLPTPISISQQLQHLAHRTPFCSKFNFLQESENSTPESISPKIPSRSDQNPINTKFSNIQREKIHTQNSTTHYPTYQPSNLLGVSLGIFILREAWRLDAFNAYPFRT